MRLPNWLIFDWITIKSFQGKWTINDSLFGTSTDVAIYEIQKSSSTGRLRLKLSGYEPKKHGIYPKIIEYFNQVKHDYTNQD